ncbi:MAG: hypothetical protein ACREBV_04195, partial [Candidatus Zixiibacteriota bacterium]
MSFNLRQLGSKWLGLLPVILPLTLCFILSIPLFGWVIDDAGISFVYARNMASGHGLVSQPGLEPVEGFSNPLWIFLIAPFFMAGVFHPYIVPKVLSLLLVGITLFFVRKTIQKLTGSRHLIPLIIMIFIVTNASFVIWTCSGLENSLFNALIAALLHLIIKNESATALSVRQCVVLGIVAGAIALSRPDGIVYSILFPLAIFLGSFPLSRKRLMDFSKPLAFYTFAFLLVFGSYFLFRVWYFGVIFPNTYYAKGGPTLASLVGALTLQQPYLSKLQEILSSIFGSKLWIVIAILTISWIVSYFVQKRNFWKEVVLA